MVRNKDRSHQRSVQSAMDQERRMAASIKSATAPKSGDSTSAPRLRQTKPSSILVDAT